MKRFKWWAGAGTIMLLGIVLLVLYKSGRAEHDAYRTVPIRKGDLKAAVASTGILAPLNTVEVGSQVSGNIQQILVDFNAAVKKDQVLALIDAALYAGQVEQAKAQLEMAKMEQIQIRSAIAMAKAAVRNARAQLFSSQAALAEADRNYVRFNALAEKRTVAGAERDTALSRRDQALAAVRMAEAQIETADAQLQRALAQEKQAAASVAERQAGRDLAIIRLNYCTIRSPIDGVVIQRNADQGQTVAATLQSPVLFTIAEDLTRMQIEVDVSEADVGRIEVGQTVEFNVDAFKEKLFTAPVREVRNSATSINNVVTYKVIADVDNHELLLRPGMTANASILVATVKDTLLLPNAALRYKPPEAVAVPVKASQQESAREGELYNKTVTALELSGSQADALAGIIERAGRKLKDAYALPEESRDIKQAWHEFLTQMLAELRQMLDADQLVRFKIYRQKLIETFKNRAAGTQRRARVFVLRGHGPEAVEIYIGITDETETQLVGNDLAEGDLVVVGKSAPKAGVPAKPGGSFFSKLRL